MKKIFSFSFSTVSVALINFISIIIFTRIFDLEDYGQANLLISYSVVFSTILSGSVDQMIIHYFYRSNLKSIINNFFKTYIIIIFFVIISLFLANRIMNLNLKELSIIVLYSNALVLNKIYINIFRMSGNSKFYFIQTTGVKIIELIIILLTYYFLLKSYEVLLVPFVTSVVILSWLQYRTIIKIVNDTSGKNNVTFKQQITFSLPLLFSILVTTLSQNIDKIVLDYFVSKENLGVYYLSYKIVGIVTIAYTIVSLMWVPLAVKKNSGGDSNEINKFLSISKNMFLVICFSLLSIYYLLSPLIIKILGNQYEEVTPILNIMICIPMLMILSELYSTYITITKNTKYHFIIAVLNLSINLVASIILSKYFGIIGASYSLLITYSSIYYIRLYFSRKISNNIIDLRTEIFPFLLIVIIVTNSILQQSFITSIFIMLVVISLLILKKDKLYEYYNYLKK